MIEGIVSSVEEVQAGTELAEDASSGDTSITVLDVDGLDLDGGSLQIGEQVDVYTLEDPEEELSDDGTGVVDLEDPLDDDWSAGDPVYTYPPAFERFAYVTAPDQEEEIEARVPHNLVDRLELGIRDPDDDPEVIYVDLEDDEYVVTDVLYREPEIDGDFIIPGTGGTSDGDPPADSPDVVVSSGPGYIVGRWTETENADPIMYEVYVSDSPGFTPTEDELLSVTPGTSVVVTELPDGSPLVVGTTYYMRLIARDVDGAAPAGLEDSGSPILIEIDAIETIDFSDVSGVVAEAQLATLAASKITGTLVSSQLGTDSVTALQIAADAVASAEIAANAVGSAEINTGAVTTLKIAADAVTAAEIAAGAVGSGELATGSVIAGKIAALTIVAADIAAGTITAAKIATDTLTANEIAASAISSSELAAGAVVAGKITAGTIVAADIAANTITAAKILADTITANEIAASAITSSELAAGAVIAGKITALTIVAGDIAANTITASQIQALGITVGALAANSVNSSKIIANTIVAADIAANTITANEILANTITAAQIAAGTITATEIAASTITAAKMNVSTLSAIAADLGSITAGTITAATFRTDSGTIPNLKIDGTNGMTLKSAATDLTGAPSIDAKAVNFVNPGTGAAMGALYGLNTLGIVNVALLEGTQATGLSGLAIGRLRGRIAANSAFVDAIAQDSLARVEATAGAAVVTLINSASDSSFLKLVANANRKIAFGTASIAAAGGASRYTQTVSHGLGVTPQVVLVTLQESNVHVFVAAHTFTSTTFTADMRQADGVNFSGAKNVSWIAIG